MRRLPTAISSVRRARSLPPGLKPGRWTISIRSRPLLRSISRAGARRGRPCRSCCESRYPGLSSSCWRELSPPSASASENATQSLGRAGRDTHMGAARTRVYILSHVRCSSTPFPTVASIFVISQKLESEKTLESNLSRRFSNPLKNRSSILQTLRKPTFTVGETSQ